MATRIAETLGQAAIQTGGTLETGAQEYVRAISATTESLASRIGDLISAADATANGIAELNRTAREAMAPLTSTASDLLAAADAVKSAAGPLNQAASTVGRSLDQMTDASRTLQASHALAGQLIESLNTATQRFEGVDRELANTLNELQTGLQGYTRQVGTFVTQIDQNLARAATQLGSLVQALQDTLDDFDLKDLRGLSGRDVQRQ